MIVVLMLAMIGYVPYKMMPTSVKERVRGWGKKWINAPVGLPLFGSILAVVMIQFVLRKCFAFGNLLLEKQLPDGWISTVLLSSRGYLSLYFTGLVAGTILTGSIFWLALGHRKTATGAGCLLIRVLGFLVAVEFLLLPVNYGVLISTEQLPRVSGFVGDEKLLEGDRGWVVWDSKDALTYLVRASDDKRELLTVPRKDVKVRIVAYDDIFCVLFSPDHAESRPCNGVKGP